MNPPKPKPPAFALWLLQHVLPADRHEALLGDLLEKYHQGRSTPWFWREVLIALAFRWGAILRTDRTEVALALLGAILQEVWWTTPWWKTVWQSSAMESLYGWGVDWPGPLCSAYDLLFHSVLLMALWLPWVVGFFSFRSGWSRAGFRRAMAIGGAVFIFGEPLVLLAAPGYHDLLAFILFFLALLLSLATSRAPHRSVQMPSAPIQQP